MGSPSYHCCSEDLHMVVHDKATIAMMVWGKFEFQNKIQNSESKDCKQSSCFVYLRYTLLEVYLRIIVRNT